MHREQSPADKVRIWHHPQEEKPNIIFFAVVCAAEGSRSLSVSRCLAWQRESRGAGRASEQIDVSSLWTKQFKEHSAWILPKLHMPFYRIPGTLLQDFTQVQHPQSLFSLACFSFPSPSPSLLLSLVNAPYMPAVWIYFSWVFGFCVSANSRQHSIAKRDRTCWNWSISCRGQFRAAHILNEAKNHLWSAFEPQQTKSKQASMWGVCGKEKLGQ